MSEKKVVRRSVAIALGIVCILLIVGLGGAMAYYTSIINTKDSTIHSLNSEYWDLHGNYTTENWWHHYYENKTEELEAPKLINVNLRADDNRPWLGTPYLHVYGQICNVGTNWAYNGKLHVVAYQSGVVAIDTYITLGTIAGESWTSVDSSVYYSGSALTSWTITPEWTDSP